MLPFWDLWDEWEIRILVVFSFSLQVFLLLFGGIRRRNASLAFRILVWLVYQLADSTATYTLGHMASWRRMSSQQHLVAFWAPFLLLHLGGQDTITAYALEDNELWLRHLLSLGVQSFGAAYLLYKYIAGANWFLIPSSILVFVAGILKYGERIWALKCASTRSMQEWIVKLDERKLCVFWSTFVRLLEGSMGCDYFAVYEDTVDAAHSMLHFSKRLFVTPSIASEWRCPRDYLNRGVDDYLNRGAENYFNRRGDVNEDRGASSYLGRSYNGPWIQAKRTYKLIDLELSLMYDLLYTKSAVIHTRYGYRIRSFSFFAIVSALLMFVLSSSISRDDDDGGYKRADLVVTYVLVVGATVLEITSIFRVLWSLWIYAYSSERTWHVDNRPRNGFAHRVLSLRWRWGVRLERWFGRLRKKQNTVSSYIGQSSMISVSAHPRTDIRWKIAKRIGLEDWWNKELCSRFIQAPPAVVEFICTEIKRRAELTKTEAKRLDEDIRQGRWTRGYDALPGEVRRRGFISIILVCHIATDIFVHCCDENEKLKTAGHLPEVATTLSNYMMYLLRVHNDILPATEGTDSWSRDMYDETCNKLLPELFNSIKVEIKQERGHRPHDILLNMDKHISEANRFQFLEKYVDRRVVQNKYRGTVFRSGSQLAAKLLETEIISLQQKFQFLADLWVDALLYVADGITPKFHAKQLSYGGEFVTYISVMIAHFGLQKQLYGPSYPKGDDACVDEQGTGDNIQPDISRSSVAAALASVLTDVGKPMESFFRN